MWPTPADLETVLGETLDAGQQLRAELLIDLAVGLVEGEARQTLSESTDTVTMSGQGTSTLVLPRWPVTAVTEVKVDDVAVTGFRFSRAGLLERDSGVWPSGLANVEVTFTAGFATIPTGLNRAVLVAAAKAWTAPVPISQESLGDHSVTYEAAERDRLRDAGRRYQASVPR